MITGGKVTFGRTVQPAQYETKRAEVEIHFTIAEGAGPEAEQAELNAAAEMAQAKALELVGLRKADKAPAAELAAPEKPAPKKADKPAAETPKQTKSKADLEAELMAQLAAKEAAAAKSAATVEDPAPNISTTPEDRKDPAAVDDDLFKADETPPQITDADLRTRITKHNEKIKNGPAIRTLIAKYVKAGQGANDIPMDKRQAFLTELEAL